MISLIDLYNKSLEVESTEETTEEVKLAEEQKEVLKTYATLADNALKEEYKKEYNEDDVVKLAGLMIEHDQKIAEEEAEIEEEANMAKVAEAVELGQIMAHSFKTEMAKDQ